MKHTKFIILFTILFASMTTRAQWTTIASGTGLNLKQIVFADSLTGYILASPILSGTSELLKTIDGGYTWNTVFSNHKILQFDFLSIDTGVVISNDTIYKTYDGGTVWTSTLSINLNPKLFRLNTADEWFFIRSQGSAYTSDGGATWTNSSTWGTIPIRPTDFQFINDTIVIGVGWYTTKSFISYDKGLHWTDLSYFLPMGSGLIWSVSFPTSLTGFATGNSRILKTTDGGINYTKIDSTLGFDIYCLRYIDANNLYGVGYGGGIAKTSDGGISWTADVSSTTNNLNKIVFINSHTAIAIGDTGTILMNTSIATGVANVNTNENLVSVFPNPTYNELRIQNNSEQPFQFALYNSLGEKLFDKMLTGKSSTINLTSYANDIYFYILSNNKKEIQSGKIVKQ